MADAFFVPMRLFLLPGSDGTDAAEDQTDDRPYVQIAVAARAKQADQPCQPTNKRNGTAEAMSFCLLFFHAARRNGLDRAA